MTAQNAQRDITVTFNKDILDSSSDDSNKDIIGSYKPNRRTFIAVTSMCVKNSTFKKKMFLFSFAIYNKLQVS